MTQCTECLHIFNQFTLSRKKDKKEREKSRKIEKKTKSAAYIYIVVPRLYFIHTHFSNARNSFTLSTIDMSDKAQTEGHWEKHSYGSQTTKVGNNPSVTVGKEADAQGTFDVRKNFPTT
jgi:hypothetical protein